MVKRAGQEGGLSGLSGLLQSYLFIDEFYPQTRNALLLEERHGAGDPTRGIKKAVFDWLSRSIRREEAVGI